MAAFPLKLGATQLRVLLVVGNLLLAIGLVGAGVWYMFQSVETTKVRVRPRTTFAPKKITVNKRSPVSAVVTVADRLQPKKPTVAPPAPPPEPEGTVDPDEVPEPTEGGPLAENWKYDFHIVNHNDPLLTHITLRKKDAKPKAGSSRGGSRRTTRASSRGGSRRGSTRSGRSTRGRGASKTKPDDHVTFYLYERKFRVPDQEEDYYVDSANQTRFIYWSAKEGPEQLYALVYVEPTIYAQNPEKGIRPEDEEKDEDDEEGEEEETKFFVTRPFHYEEDFEAEYSEIRGGELDLKDARLINEKAKEIEAGKRSEEKAALRRPPPRQPSSRPSARPKPRAKSEDAGEQKDKGAAPASTESEAAGDAAEPPKKEMTKEEGLKQIGGILDQAERDGKLSDKDKEAAKELQKMLTPPRRKAYTGGNDGG